MDNLWEPTPLPTTTTKKYWPPLASWHTYHLSLCYRGVLRSVVDNEKYKTHEDAMKHTTLDSAPPPHRRSPQGPAPAQSLAHPYTRWLTAPRSQPAPHRGQMV